ncbi:unnamed protein product [Acanthoscelides obtectus]|uniref:Uncharacterized protein n=1 Tax=Acanthoscelides obtectus TaxID=200917 RepID=A0A9P0QHI8_ACAOB|nr:unnamed protein product [Acanthoscelides obtectus]
MKCSCGSLASAAAEEWLSTRRGPRDIREKLKDCPCGKQSRVCWCFAMAMRTTLHSELSQGDEGRQQANCPISGLVRPYSELPPHRVTGLPDIAVRAGQGDIGTGPGPALLLAKKKNDKLLSDMVKVQ